MIKSGLIYECPAGPDEPTWRDAEGDDRQTLRITETGLKVVGVIPLNQEGATGTARAHLIEPHGDNDPSATGNASVLAEHGDDSGSRKVSKQATVIDLLKRPEGSTVDEIMAATGWQAHSVRSAISGTVKRKLGFTVTSQKVEGHGRVYRIASDE